MKTKLDQIKDALTAGDYRTALRIAAGFPQLGEQKERITKGWAALTQPAFYLELGHDPAALVADGVRAIRERYQIPTETK
jgi:hypothetical protein